jgi:hypothetical protein
VQVFGRRDDGLTTRSGGRRPKSAKAQNRVRCAAGVPRALWGFSREFGLAKGGALRPTRSVCGLSNTEHSAGFWRFMRRPEFGIHLVKTLASLSANPARVRDRVVSTGSPAASVRSGPRREVGAHDADQPGIELEAARAKSASVPRPVERSPY